ncbi:MAG: N-acetyl-gamma-glutamyl-phosphate reductase [Candidatus Bipolaricaulia bacterium]
MGNGRFKVAVVGGSGYTGGELLRILLRHPQVELTAVTSRKYQGRSIYKVHPNLRGTTDLKFIHPDNLGRYDVLFSALPHGASMGHMNEFLGIAEMVVDLSADFRLKKPEDYERWYGIRHEAPELLEQAVYGLPELHRDRLPGATLVAVPGCNAAAAIIPLKPIVDRFAVERVIVDAKVGSSAAGVQVGLASHHPERSHVVRSYQPAGHRHTAEMEQELGLERNISFSPHAVELVRGIMCTIHTFLTEDYTEKDIWRAYREAYSDEPFVRFVKERGGIYRYPEPKIVFGTNYCDIGFAKDERTNRLVVMSAIDNLTKGAAGDAVQAMNLALGIEEQAGLEALGFHPI